MVDKSPVLTDEDLLYILETQIPALLARRPDLEKRVYAAFLDTFARREEVAAIMDELRSLRTEFHGFRWEALQRFERVEQHLEQIDQHLEQVDQHLGHIDKRLEQVDQRFEQVDRRFEQVDQRFEQVDRRFEQVDQRFEQVDRRFEQVDQRFERVEGRLDDLDRRFQDLKDWVEMVVGHFQVRSGRKLEDVVAGALRLALQRPDLRPDQIRLRQKIVDTEGLVFPRGRQKEVGVIVSDGEYLVFEVKSAAEVEDVDDFADKLRLFGHLHPDKTVGGVFITLAPEPDVRERCRELGIRLVS